MTPEIYVSECTPEFDTPPKGTLHVRIGAKSESGQVERIVEIVFDGADTQPKLRNVRNNIDKSEEARL